MNRLDVMAWVREYERSWRAGDTTAVSRLFTEDARYFYAPFEPPEIGHTAIEAFWADDVGRTFDVTAEPVAVEAHTAVVRVEVHYLTPDDRLYRNLWVLTFAADGRVGRFEEWAFFPGQRSSAAD